MFSSRKHLIFRSYEKGTVITYLTKRVKIKGETAMDYYQFHIYNNVLPYLARMNGGATSFLRVRPQLGEVMIQGKYSKK